MTSTVLRVAGFVHLFLFALVVLALVITLAVNVPIDRAIDRWTVDTLPADWTASRDRWQAFHTSRTAASLAGFGCALAAILWASGGRAAVER